LTPNAPDKLPFNLELSGFTESVSLWDGKVESVPGFESKDLSLRLLHPFTPNRELDTTVQFPHSSYLHALSTSMRSWDTAENHVMTPEVQEEHEASAKRVLADLFGVDSRYHWLGDGATRNVHYIPDFPEFVVKIPSAKLSDRSHEFSYNVMWADAFEGALKKLFQEHPPKTFHPIFPITEEWELPPELARKLASKGLTLSRLQKTFGISIARRAPGILLRERIRQLLKRKNVDLKEVKAIEELQLPEKYLRFFDEVGSYNALMSATFFRTQLPIFPALDISENETDLLLIARRIYGLEQSNFLREKEGAPKETEKVIRFVATIDVNPSLRNVLILPSDRDPEEDMFWMVDF
jgi:hypothetical protein